MIFKPNTLRSRSLALTTIGLLSLGGCTVATGTKTVKDSTSEKPLPEAVQPVTYEFPFKTTNANTMLQFSTNGAEVLENYGSFRVNTTEAQTKITKTLRLGPFSVKNSVVHISDISSPASMVKRLAFAHPVFALEGCAADGMTATSIEFDYQGKNHSILGLELPINCHQVPGAEQLNDVTIFGASYPIQR